MPTTTGIAEAFSRHRFRETVPHMLDDLEWTLVGERTIVGKADVVAACEESAGYLADVSTTFTAFKVVANQDSVVIDSRAKYVDRDGETSHVASCDIYEFVDGRLAGITSYTVELSPG